MYRVRPWYEQTLNHWIFDHVSIQTVGSDTHFYFGNVCLACVPASRLVRDLTCVPVSVFQEKMNQRLVPAAEQFVALRLRYVAAFTNRCLVFQVHARQRIEGCAYKAHSVRRERTRWFTSPKQRDRGCDTRLPARGSLEYASV